MRISLGELARQFDCELLGDPAIEVDCVATIGNATANSVTFLANPAYKKSLPDTRAGAVILAPSEAAECPVAALVSNNPYATYARVAALLYPEPTVDAAVHPTAVIAKSAIVADSSFIGPFAVIGENCSVGAGAYVGPGCVLGDDCHIGSGTRLVSNVSLVRRVSIGERSKIYPGVVIGSPGFGFAPDTAGWVHVPQVGRVQIGDDVEIGSNTTIDCGAIEDTVIGNGVKLDNQIQIGHNVRIGEHTVMAATVGIAGSTIVGKRCMFGGASGTVGHISICDGVIVNGLSMVSKDITEPGTYAGSFPATDVRSWRRYVARFRQVDRIAKRVAKLEALKKKNE